MKFIKPYSYSHPVLPSSRVTILGSGNVTKSLLLTASLLRPNTKFRVIARSVRSAELIREFLNDLPRIDVQVETFPTVPDLAKELVIMTLGVPTSRSSKKSSKESLYAVNERLVKDIIPQIRSSVVIVVTNPSTAITKFLVEQGIQAYGIGVANDQLRFNNQAGDVLDDHYFVGAHTFHELVLGSLHSKRRTSLLFSHEDYKSILNKQDNKKFSVKNAPFSFLDFDWQALEKTNASFPPEYRWYARQRIHSKYHSTTISCALATLNTVCFFTKQIPLYNNLSLEMPLFLPGTDSDVVLGWPIDGASMQPLKLTFDKQEEIKLGKISEKYTIRHKLDAGHHFYLSSPFEDSIILNGPPAFVHDFYQTRLAHLFSLSSTIGGHEKTMAEINIIASSSDIDNAVLGHSIEEWNILPQHRGKNPQEHTDIKILNINNSRVVKFADGDSSAIVYDSLRRVDVFSNDKESLSHELRRLIRDEIGVPCFVARGARIMHAALLSFKGVSVLILGPSGGGKTTAALSLICSDSGTAYGAAERTLVWVAEHKLLALGIPESVTVFPGTLKSIPEFEYASKGLSEIELWEPRNKIRLQAHDIIEQSGSVAIQREVQVDIIVEVVYDASLDTLSASVVEENERRKVFMRNDLTEGDPVRLPWLGWFPKNPSRELYDFVRSSPSLNIHTITWSTMESLKSRLIDIIARKKLYDDAFAQVRLRV